MNGKLLALGLGLVCLPGMASAQAVISNGTIGLGVDAGGQLNVPSSNLSAQGTTTYYGLRDIASNREATADGCLCEGWGASNGTSTVYANNALGNNYNLVSFSSTATTATSVVTSFDGALRVTQVYSPSSSRFLYQDVVTIENISGADFTGNTLYRRTMDWDIEPTAFNEYSTIQGTALATHVLDANDDGFCSSNPLAGCGQLLASGDFIDSGPADHGANFDFTFDPLKAGGSQTLTIFYGATPTEALGLTALNDVGAEVYSFGQSVDDKTGGVYSTFIFGFEGVGGTVVPSGTPEPATWAMMLIGFGGIGAIMRRRATKVTFA